MKKFLIAMSAALFVVACAPQTSFQLKGKLTAENAEQLNGPVYLMQRGGASDTTEMVNGEFAFSGELAEPTNYYLLVGAENIPLFIEPANYTVEGEIGKLREAVINGGETQDLLNQMKAISKEIQAQHNLDSLAQAFNRTQDEEQREAIYAVFQEVNDQIDAKKEELMAKFPNTHFAFQEFYNGYAYMEFEAAKEKYNYYAGQAKFKNLTQMEKIKTQLDRLEGLQVGKQAPDFTLNDPEGNPITLSDIYKNNKVTMIDFWAGWCGPCRQFNPKLVEIYKQFHDQGFEVLGVSLDKDHAKWVDAIKTDYLTWPQVSELKYWDSEIAKTYAIRYIPQNLFVDQNGIIIGRVIAEENMVDFLTEQLQK